jgi:hypothetical protein
MHDDEFRPATLELQVGSRVTIEVRNEGKADQTLTIDSVDLSTAAGGDARRPGGCGWPDGEVA